MPNYKRSSLMLVNKENVNPYIKVGAERVMVGSDIVEGWKGFYDLNINKVEYTQRTVRDADGNAVLDANGNVQLEDHEWSRLEVTGFRTKEEMLDDARFEGQIAKISKEFDLDTTELLSADALNTI